MEERGRTSLFFGEITDPNVDFMYTTMVFDVEPSGPGGFRIMAPAGALKILLA